MIKVNAMGDTCPIPIIKAKQAIEQLGGNGQVEVLVDNDIAVQNLTKMAVQKQYDIKSCKIEEGKYQVVISVGESLNELEQEEHIQENLVSDGNTVVVISSEYMGDGEKELGKVLMKGFIYSLTQMEVLPKTIIFYNSGVFITCKESAELDDLKAMQEQGVEILSCGTCVNYYKLEDSLKVGSVTNMYDIVQRMMNAGKVVKP